MASLILLFAVNIFAQANTSCPKNMVMIPEGEFIMGRDSTDRTDQTPSHLVKMSKYCIDETLVTYDEFAKFVAKTNYKTTAEIKGYGMVAIETMKDWDWKITKNAYWRQPFGPDLKKSIPMKADYPVVSVSWHDANSYCMHFGKKLPTEAQWEYAARAGHDGFRFPWGEDIYRKDGKIGLNFWQGESHHKNEKQDGHIYMSPVKAFPPNEWGMYDPVGNVWQWTADWYDEKTYHKNKSITGIQDPSGPSSGVKKVTRGGSWWCSKKTCDGFGLYYRGKSVPTAVFNNKGFRCIKEL